MNKADVLNRFIPNSLYAIETLNLAIHLKQKWGQPQPMKILIAGELTIEGNSNAFTNPAIEAGIIHCRALLEFLGLGMSKDGALQNLARPRKSDDFGIEHFSNATGPLARVLPAQAVSHHPGGTAEAEQALLSVFRIANKGLAHLTSSFLMSPEETRLLKIASQTIPILIDNYLYKPRGLHAPLAQISSRPREIDKAH
jgi:hypothetical protein